MQSVVILNVIILNVGILDVAMLSVPGTVLPPNLTSLSPERISRSLMSSFPSRRSV
jgi:hypothetical protein